MSAEEDDSEKPHEASQRKLDEARRKGDLPRLADLTAMAGLAGFLVLAALPGGWVPLRLGDLGLRLTERADTLGPALMGDGAAAEGLILAEITQAMAPALLIPAAAVLGLLIALRGLVFAPEKLAPRLSRISLLANAKQKFGAAGLVEFAKNTVKMALFAAALWITLASDLPGLMATIGQDPGAITVTLLTMLAEFLAVIVAVMALVGVVDHLWQRFDHSRRQRMSDREMRDEHRDSEGDPQTRQARRQRANALATGQMIAQVPTASVVIVNPTHYAVALRWSPSQKGAPVCVAKGTDEVAARIRAAARAAGVPIHSDPPTARALHASVHLGREIAPDHYAAVAAAIRFADAMRAKARARQGAPARP